MASVTNVHQTIRTMTKKIIHTNQAPSAIGPYSQAVQAGDTLYCSGQIGFDPESGQLVEGGVANQAEQVMKNVEAVLSEAGYAFSDVVLSTIFLVSMDDFATVNEIYGARFPENPPARATVAVSTLPKNVDVEISCVACK